jgi:hypothetical protein
VALLNGSLRQEFGSSTYQRRQFLFHPQVIEQAPICSRRERSQYVHIAFRVEIVTQHGAEQGKLGDVPTATEVSDWLSRYGDISVPHRVSSPDGAKRRGPKPSAEAIGQGRQCRRPRAKDLPRL